MSITTRQDFAAGFPLGQHGFPAKSQFCRQCSGFARDKAVTNSTNLPKLALFLCEYYENMKISYFLG